MPFTFIRSLFTLPAACKKYKCYFGLGYLNSLLGYHMILRHATYFGRIATRVISVSNLLTCSREGA